MTALSPSATELSTEELEILSRKRRDLATAVEDGRQDRARIQAKLKALGSDLEDAAVIEHISQLQKLLQASTVACSNAEAALNTWDASHPSEAELAHRASVIATEKARVTREEARQPFLKNRREAIELLERLRSMDGDARQMIATAKLGTFPHAAEAADLADLLRNWLNYDRDADGLTYVRRALKSI